MQIQPTVPVQQSEKKAFFIFYRVIALTFQRAPLQHLRQHISSHHRLLGSVGQLKCPQLKPLLQSKYQILRTFAPLSKNIRLCCLPPSLVLKLLWTWTQSTSVRTKINKRVSTFQPQIDAPLHPPSQGLSLKVT